MAAVLTTASIIVCAHEAPVVFKPGQTILLAGGAPALTGTHLLGAEIPACPNVGPGLTPCGRIVSIDAGLSATLLVGAEPVVLANASGTTQAVPQPAPWKVSTTGPTNLETS